LFWTSGKCFHFCASRPEFNSRKMHFKFNFTLYVCTFVTSFMYKNRQRSCTFVQLYFLFTLYVCTFVPDRWRFLDISMVGVRYHIYRKILFTLYVCTFVLGQILRNAIFNFKWDISMDIGWNFAVFYSNGKYSLLLCKSTSSNTEESIIWRQCQK
jgi:hypothetical protein